MDTNKHLAIVGITGSGKTYFANWIYQNTTGLAIFFNTQLERKVELASDVLVTDMKNFTKAFNMEKDGKRIYRRICFNPNEDEDIAHEQLISLIKLLFRLGYQINKNAQTPKVWCHLFIDEIHEFSSQLQKDKVVDRVWKRGRRYGIVGIAITQRPAEVSHAILANCPTHIIFKTGQYELPYYQRYHIPIFTDDENFKWLQKKYCFIVFYDGRVEKYPPIE